MGWSFLLSSVPRRRELALKRKLSFPVSRMWQRWVRRSSRAVVILASPKTVAPFAEAKVGGDDHAGALVELAQQVEEQRSTRRAERKVSELIQDQQIETDQRLGDLASLASGLFLLERIDQFDGREEADLSAIVLDSLDAR